MARRPGLSRLTPIDAGACLPGFHMLAMVLALWASLAVATVPSAAQNGPVPGRSAMILIVDMQRIKSDTAAGRDMLAKTIEIRKRIQEGVAQRGEALRKEERRLAEERENLDPEEFRKQVRAFEQQVFTNREFSERESRRLQLVLSRASALLTERATAVFAAIMRERKAEVLLDSTQIVLSVDSLDITGEAIRRLDKILPEMPIALVEPEVEP